MSTMDRAPAGTSRERGRETGREPVGEPGRAPGADTGADAGSSHRLADELEVARAEIRHLHDSLDAAYAVSREHWQRAEEAEERAADAERAKAETEELLTETRGEMETALHKAAAAAAELKDSRDMVSELETDLEFWRGKAATLQAELFALRSTRILRLTGWFRRAYARMRGLPRPSDTIDVNRGPAV